jgi:dihydroflavonol-4-reductase
MKALVTGATGLIGSHIVRALIAEGHDVRALVRAGSNRAALKDLPVEFIVGNMQSGDLANACRDRDVVFHAAAHFAYTGISPATLHDTAVAGTQRLLHAAASADVRQVIVTSSSVVFGYAMSPTQIDEAADLVSEAGESPYVASKLSQHRQAAELAETLHLDVRFACPTMTLGPSNARLGPSNGLIVAYLSDPFRCTFPGGCNLVAARDVARGHLQIAQRGSTGESYLLGSENLTWRQIHTIIAKLAGVPPPAAQLTHSLAWLAATADEIRAALAHRIALSTREQAAMIGRYYWYSHAKATALGYEPASAHDALVEAIAWLAASPHISRETRINMHLAPEIYRFRAGAAA